MSSGHHWVDEDFDGFPEEWLSLGFIDLIKMFIDLVKVSINYNGDVMCLLRTSLMSFRCPLNSLTVSSIPLMICLILEGFIDILKDFITFRKGSMNFLKVFMEVLQDFIDFLRTPLV